MSKEQEIQAAIVVFPDTIEYASPELNHATELACFQMCEFVDYIQTLDPELERHETITLVAAIFQGLPALFESNPELIAEIKIDCHNIKAKRR
ncbi:hypothetical protein PQG02_06920 [Nostoc sp. UHCC 0926]|uniref:hypothetical protein n=1 Tax=unclassified Nostoc TaxID=2593658 RepID=UPI00235E51C1|nr:hypothetical protein [Nostoc sp. UHCC 0926]WDD34073.1 hypothetical protein PQG02_06920 [Nostoc sp. UHCC 0926]